MAAGRAVFAACVCSAAKVCEEGVGVGGVCGSHGSGVFICGESFFNVADGGIQTLHFSTCPNKLPSPREYRAKAPQGQSEGRVGGESHANATRNSRILPENVKKIEVVGGLARRSASRLEHNLKRALALASRDDRQG